MEADKYVSAPGFRLVSYMPKNPWNMIENGRLIIPKVIEIITSHSVALDNLRARVHFCFLRAASVRAPVTMAAIDVGVQHRQVSTIDHGR